MRVLKVKVDNEDYHALVMICKDEKIDINQLNLHEASHLLNDIYYRIICDWETAIKSEEFYVMFGHVPTIIEVVEKWKEDFPYIQLHNKYNPKEKIKLNQKYGKNLE